MEIEKLKYPIGKFSAVNNFDQDYVHLCIQRIENLPTSLEKIKHLLVPENAEKLYRPGGWTVKQVLAHIADSHTHGYLRTKFALADSGTKIKPYDENQWVLLPDYTKESMELNLEYISVLQKKWAYLWKQLSPKQFEKYYIHPQYQETVPLFKMLDLYQWHGRQHLAHLQLALEVPIMLD